MASHRFPELSVRLAVVCVLLLGISNLPYSSSAIPDESWGYVNVRSNANLFWWLYGTTDTTKRETAPTVVWLQGGPGASSTGFGNFEEIGPLDENLNPRPINWVQSANVLFIDSPVGSGFSYVTSDDAYCTTDEQIGIDLVTLLKQLVAKYPNLQTNPFWIFCESYGGKEATSFGVALSNAITKKEITINFKGVALGDSWISPEDFVLAYADYLYAVSEVDSAGKNQIESSAQKVSAAIKAQDWIGATNYWGVNQGDIDNTTYNIDFYNILNRQPQQAATTAQEQDQEGQTSAITRLLKKYQDDPLTTLMNGKIREKLGIIPSTVVWGGQSGNVFQKLSGAFMKPYISQVDYLISQNYYVVVYSGNLDLICCTTGTINWMNKLSWVNYPKFDSSPRLALTLQGEIVSFKKEYDKFKFYTVLSAGHMVPSDQPGTAKQMLDDIISSP